MKFNQKFSTINLQTYIIKRLTTFLRLFIIPVSLMFAEVAFAQQSTTGEGRMEVGVARIDITPIGPIRMGGHVRKTGSEGGGRQPFDKALHRLGAKALAFGSDAQGPSILITVDLIGIPGHITAKVAERLSRKTGLDPAQLAICASHTHSGPEVGNLLNLTLYYSDPPVTQAEMVQIARYLDQLTDKLEQVALAALKARSPALVSWGQGEVGFAINRRGIENGKWVAQRNVPEGPVDHSLPLLRVTDLNGKLRAVFVNYASHCTTLGGNILQMHGDWNGEAQRLIEAKHPYATAMVAMGCGADANPKPRGKMEFATQNGQEIADEVDRLLATSLHPLTAPPVGHLKHIDLPFEHVLSVDELAELTKDTDPRGYNASLFLDRLVRGEKIPASLSYPVQTWMFGNEMAMVFLGGEVVVDYSLRLKKELGAERMWVNAYANDVASYIPSRRVLREGGYEAEGHIYYYNQPSRLAEEVEELIIGTVHDLLPASFKPKSTVRHESNGNLHLNAETGRAIGPEIKYMPEWKAFGWFTAADRVEWDVDVSRRGEYEVFLEWSISDDEAGKPFIFQAGDKKLHGKIGRTGSWEDYKMEKIGRIRLSAGRQKMVFKPNSNFEKGALMDLREVKLVPIN